MNRKTKPLFFLFVIVSIAEIILISTGNETLRIFTKPLIIPFLAGIYHLNAISPPKKNYKDPVLLGLFFSWIGDILLQNEGYFIPGLMAFLIAHIFYILFFASTQSANTSFFKLRPVMIIAVIAYLIELMILLWPHLGGMKIPVLVYGITISTMLSAAFWQYQKLDNTTALYLIFGAGFFVASDSILALNKFKTQFDSAGIYIMSTYILAQLFIVLGAIRYRNIPQEQQ
ncbi:MAG: lysoplasmalogenase [Chitinophagaceae bacterium]|jgi:uncharacterized membrane protein YhhN|nr:lysoplasmalogenase [Chitinophagaceae bacterium]